MKCIKLNDQDDVLSINETIFLGYLERIFDDHVFFLFIDHTVY